MGREKADVFRLPENLAKKASEIFKQLEGLKISEAKRVLDSCYRALEECPVKADHLHDQ